jgi:hypothetical protein
MNRHLNAARNAEQNERSAREEAASDAPKRAIDEAKARVDAVVERLRPHLKTATPEFLRPLSCLLPDRASLDLCKSALRCAGLPVKLAQSLQHDRFALTRLRDTRSLERRGGERLKMERTGRPAVTLPTGTPRERLDAVIEANVLLLANTQMRLKILHEVEVGISEDGVVSASTTSDYAGKSGRWCFYSYKTGITIGRDWLRDVKKQRISCIEDKTILAADTFRQVDDEIDATRVKFLMQTTGANVEVRDAHVARHRDTGIASMKPTEEAAVRTVRTAVVNHRKDAARREDEAREREIREANDRIFRDERERTEREAREAAEFMDAQRDLVDSDDALPGIDI